MELVERTWHGVFLLDYFHDAFSHAIILGNSSSLVLLKSV